MSARNTKEQELKFIYVAHDRTTPVGQLADRLSALYEDAVYDSSLAVIFYLANSDSPKIVKINLPGDNRKDFEDFLGELWNKSAHEIYAEVDREKIPGLLNGDTDFIGEDGLPEFSNFTMTYYVTPTFWNMGYNEYIIAAVYFILELDKMPPRSFEMQIWHSRDDGLKYDTERPFGSKNLCAGYQFLLLQY